MSGKCISKCYLHDDVIKWKHFPLNWPFVRGIHRSPVNFPHKGQWRGALMFSLICVWINDWVSNREAGDLRRYRAHYDVIVMQNFDHFVQPWIFDYEVVTWWGNTRFHPFVNGGTGNGILARVNTIRWIDVNSWSRVMRSAPSHYLKQCWNIINWTLAKKLQWNLNRNSHTFIKENAFENVVWKMTAILSRIWNAS